MKLLTSYNGTQPVLADMLVRLQVAMTTQLVYVYKCLRRTDKIQNLKSPSENNL